ncbi:DNA fragmentation factor subunit alpha-like [Physella acuta]|uniref:DNA fragmentation factor subunit alpha-like n=1 Tax=Physella acuta TaxID=109671 RepID=UPI0027DD9B9D|nr:DNA fragmentation factor subunit alpha-like [Physella acuta]
MDDARNDASGNNKPFKIWSSDRETRKSITAATLNELISRGCQKLGLESSKLKVVLEQDGTEVDEEDYFAFLQPNTVLMFLVDGEKWRPCDKQIVIEQDVTDGEADDVEQVSQLIKNNLSHIIMLSNQQLQVLVDCDTTKLACLLGEKETTTQTLQDACQRSLDERLEANEAIELLKLFHKSKEHSNHAKSSDEKKRKMEENL